MPKRAGRDPGAPKRNKSAFLLYQDAMRVQFQVLNPGMTSAQLARFTADVYSELPPSEKEAWVARAEADKARYLHELASYVPPPDSDRMAKQSSPDAVVDLTMMGSPVLATMSSKRTSPDLVVDLTMDSEDENEQEVRLGDVRRNLLHHASKKVKTEGVSNEPEPEEDAAPSRVAGMVSVKSEGAAKVAPTASYEDVEVVQAAVPAMVAAAPENENQNDGDDVVMVGTVNEVKLPHMRPHCTKFKFQINSFNRQSLSVTNSEHCDLCYCYVCDCPVKDCKGWVAAGHVAGHCDATDQLASWVQKRRLQQTSRSKSSQQTSCDRNNDGWSPNRDRVRELLWQDRVRELLWEAELDRPLRLDCGPGPWPPDRSDISDYCRVMKCRKCGWYSKRQSTPWCDKCGRVANESTFSDVAQFVPYESSPQDYCLGTRRIPFRLFAPDVRSIEKYRASWSQADTTKAAWTYDESEMEEDTFKHYIGTRPTIGNLLKMIAPMDEEKYKEIARGSDYQKGAIFLENKNDLILLRLLHNDRGFELFCGNEGHLLNGKVGGDIKAEWAKEKRSGTIEIRLFLPNSCLESRHDTTRHFSLLLGAWFNLFPFDLGKISGALKAETFLFGNRRGESVRWPHPLFQKFGDNPNTANATLMMKAAVKEHNNSSNPFRAMISLTSSSGLATVGGVTGIDRDNGLKGMLERFYRETFLEETDLGLTPEECIYYDYENSCLLHDRPIRSRSKGPWLHLEKGITSNHNVLLGNEVKVEPWEKLDLILNFKDRVLVETCLRRDVYHARRNRGTTNGVMKHLENLGHESEVVVEGLKVELLEFQKQSLRWALEREKTPRGIQRYFWAKIRVSQANLNTHLYYCPILETFKRNRPNVVRGGFIAEEMGLGKTIITLALILKNPAPESPVSGSSATLLQNGPQPSDKRTSNWNKHLQTDTSNSPKRGSIISRGTLVICPVSLVGQWIDEAKSKLKDPGLIYPYHGQSRKRDANILAKNAIVVTTYQVLASDAVYHKKKSNDAFYCPPLEQIRWWRIVCDEGHSLRQANTQRNHSISSLVSDHKWLVSGTPVNTSISDLKSQLKFLGIEMVDEMFRTFCYSERRRARESTGAIEAPGKLLFFLRSIMMRHTQKQTYSGTETTLMSLPAKKERVIEVSLTQTEKEEYDTLDAQAKSFYLNFKAAHELDLSSYYLTLSQKLTPMRVACSGGFFPLDEGESIGADGQEEEEEGMNGRPQRGLKKKVVKYSELAFTSKFKVLLSELERIRDEDPTSKSLVFSQFVSTLNWLKEELPKHGFQFRTLSGDMSMKQRAKALHDFQLDPPTTIFLLSMRAGNCGINLTQANRVFLMEPGFNPALEQQAIGRVHRLGQKREVEIVRLIVKESVESRIRIFLEKKYNQHSTLSGTGDAAAKAAAVVGPVGNVATEKPKSKILAAEFDILFGVEDKDETSDENVPDVALSSGFV